MQTVKIVVIGPKQVGKSTFITSASEITVRSTERRIVSATGDATSVVPMDFGRITISDDLVLYLFGVPANDEPGFPWDAFSDGILGVVIIGDATSDASLARVRGVAESFARSSDVPFAVALNMWRDLDADSVARARGRIGMEEPIPVIPCDARDRDSVKAVLLELLGHVVGSLPDPAATPVAPTGADEG
jgi:uncharacterized protein